MSKPLLAALLLAVALVACAKSPYEQGRALGTKHAAQLRAKTLTFEHFTEDLDDAVDEDTDEDDTASFRRGYAEAIGPMRLELAALIAGAAAAETARGLGHATDEVIRQLRSGLDDADREAIREAGKKAGEILRTLEDGAKEFGKGFEEGAKQKR